MSGPYDVLMVDPPWPVTTKFTETRGIVSDASFPYNTMNVDALGPLLDRDVFAHAASPHVVFLWTTERFLVPGDAMMEQRGYRLHTRFVWDKNDGPFIGTVRRTHEYLEWWHKPRLLPVAEKQRGVWPTVLRSVQREHSRKPSAAYAMVEALYPDAKRLDAFTREYRVGWDAFGDEKDKFTPLLAGLREEVEA